MKIAIYIRVSTEDQRREWKMRFYIIYSIILLALFPFGLVYAQNSPKDHLQQGLKYEYQGMLDKALEEYEKAIALDPNYSDALYNAGILYFRAQKWEDSIRCLERVVTLNPSDGEAYYNLSVAYFGLERYNDAIRAHDKSIELGFLGKAEFRSLIEPYRYKEIDFEYTPLLTDGKEKMIIKIKGNPTGDKLLIYDTIKNLETFDHHFRKGMFKNVNVEFIRWEKDGETHIEKWTIIRDDNTQKPYWVRYIPDPQRGTKLLISEKEELPESGQEKIIIEIR